MLLHEFLSGNLETIGAVVRRKFLQGQDRAAVADRDDSRLQLFLKQLIETLRDGAADSASANPEIRQNAAKHGANLLAQGFTVAQVVHGYGSVCQAVTDLVVELNAHITASEFRTLNQCLDAAIAEAVTEYSRQRDQSVLEKSTKQLGSLAHELRNLLSSALLSFETLEKGEVGVAGNTGAVLGRSLIALRNLIDRTLSEVRLDAELQRFERVRVAELVEEVEASATLEAKGRGVRLVVAPGEYAVFIAVDRHLISSAVSNLVQNAIKFTPRGGFVRVTVQSIDGRVLIDVADQCGGLPEGKLEELFLPFVQAHTDRGGLGLGLLIARRAAEANHGVVRVQNLPGEGCVFTVDLPAAMAPL